MLKKENKNIERSVSDFLNFRKGLSEEEKSAEAGRLIEEIDSVDVDGAYRNVRKRISQKRTSGISLLTVITRVAAILAIPLLVFNIWHFTYKGSSFQLAENEYTLQEISSPIGMKTHVVLPDGTDIWLNSGSKINYRIPFVGKCRTVALTGEAYLHVVKNQKSPFILKAEKTKIKVLGTQFNVKSYPEDDQIEVALIEGSVKFSFEKNGKIVSAKLKPNELLTLNKRNKHVFVKKEKLFKYIAWHKNILVFDETPITEVAKSLERWYGVEVLIKDEEIKKYKFNAVFENEPLTRVLDLLELTSPISIKYKVGKMNKKTNILNKSVITISKK
jgi:ferric-dicitrate binding protein FerR (iron transport regulator)